MDLTELKERILEALSPLLEKLQPLIEKLKAFYFALEDRYYSFLDFLESKGIPVYKVVDPIDKVVPSFMLFSGIFFLLVIFLLLALLGALAPNIGILHIVDESGNSLASVPVTVSFPEEDKIFSTDENGFVQFLLSKSEENLNVSVSAEDFADFSEVLFFISGQAVDVTLEKKQLLFNGPQNYTINLADSKTGQLITKPVTLAFSCSLTTDAPPTVTVSTGIFTLALSSIPADCGQLSVTASVSGYDSSTRQLTSNQANVFIQLSPKADDIAPKTGALDVTVLDNQNNPVADVKITLVDESTSSQSDVGYTDESGDYSFENIAPGRYSVSALADDGRTASESNIQISAGTLETTTLYFEQLVLGKKLFFKLISSDGNSSVSNADVTIYKDSVLVDVKSTGSEGTIQMSISDSNAVSSFLGVIRHKDYLLKIATLQKIDASSGSPQIISLEKTDANKSAALNVTVVDEESIAQDGAKVFLYSRLYGNSIVLNNPSGDLTDKAGIFSFKNLAPETYFVKAVKQSKDANSEDINISAGETADLTVFLVLGSGEIIVTVSDQATGEKLAGALVEFLSANSGALFSQCTSAADGKCPSGQIPADKTVAVKASKTGYLSSIYFSEIDIISKNTAQIGISLKPLSDVPAGISIATEFVSLCKDFDCKQPTTKIDSLASGKATYFLRFILISADANLSQIKQHFRVGPDSQLSIPTAGYVLQLNSVYAPLSSGIVLSNCFNAQNIFESSTTAGCSVLPNSQPSTAAKSAIISYPSLSKTIVPITLKIFVEPALQQGTLAEASFAASAKKGAENVSDPVVPGKPFGDKDNVKKKIFKIGQNDCSASTEKFDWGFWFGDVNKTYLVASDTIKNTITIGSAYEMNWLVLNCDKDFSSADLKYQFSDSAQTIQFPEETGTQPYSLFSLPFPKDTLISSDLGFRKIKLLPVLQTSNAKIEFKVSSAAQPLASKSLLFKINSGKQLKVEGLPEGLSPLGFISLSGTVKDANSSQAVKNAAVTARYAIAGEDNLTLHDSVKSNDSGGFTLKQLPSLANINYMEIQVIASGYDTKYVQIPVTTEEGPLTEDFSCVKISQDKGKIYLERKTGTPNFDSFTVDVSACEKKPTLTIESELETEPATGATISFTASSTAIVKVYADSKTNLSPIAPGAIVPSVALGEYFVGLRGKFTAQNFSPIFREVNVYINDPNSCLQLVNPVDFNPADPKFFNVSDPATLPNMKSSYDILHKTDTGLIFNKCHFYVLDDDIPKFETLSILGGAQSSVSFENFVDPAAPPVKVERAVKFSSGFAEAVEGLPETFKTFILEGKLEVWSDNGSDCYINGKSVYKNINRIHPPYYYNYAYDVSEFLKPGKNIIACRVDDYGGGAGFDAQLIVNTSVVIKGNSSGGEQWKNIILERLSTPQSQGGINWFDVNYADSSWSTCGARCSFTVNKSAFFRKEVMLTPRSYESLVSSADSFNLSTIAPSTLATEDKGKVNPFARAFVAASDFYGYQTGWSSLDFTRAHYSNVSPTGYYIPFNSLPRGTLAFFLYSKSSSSDPNSRKTYIGTVAVASASVKITPAIKFFLDKPAEITVKDDATAEDIYNLATGEFSWQLNADNDGCWWFPNNSILKACTDGAMLKMPDSEWDTEIELKNITGITKIVFVVPVQGGGFNFIDLGAPQIGKRIKLKKSTETFEGTIPSDPWPMLPGAENAVWFNITPSGKPTKVDWVDFLMHDSLQADKHKVTAELEGGLIHTITAGITDISTGTPSSDGFLDTGTSGLALAGGIDWSYTVTQNPYYVNFYNSDYYKTDPCPEDMALYALKGEPYDLGFNGGSGTKMTFNCVGLAGTSKTSVTPTETTESGVSVLVGNLLQIGDKKTIQCSGSVSSAASVGVFAYEKYGQPCTPTSPPTYNDQCKPVGSAIRPSCSEYTGIVEEIQQTPFASLAATITCQVGQPGCPCSGGWQDTVTCTVPQTVLLSCPTNTINIGSVNVRIPPKPASYTTPYSPNYYASLLCAKVSGQYDADKLSSMWQGERHLGAGNKYPVNRLVSRIGIESGIDPNGASSKLFAARYQFESTDKDHFGLINFNVLNNSLVGKQTFALLRVSDYVSASGAFSAPGVDVPFSFTIQASSPDLAQGCNATASFPNNVLDENEYSKELGSAANVTGCPATATNTSFSLQSLTSNVGLRFKNSNTAVTTDPADIIVAFYAPLGTETDAQLLTEYFNVRLKTAASDQCIASDGSLGKTGAQFAPRVFFDWSMNNIDFNKCAIPGSGYYCDSTQSAISLWKRLLKIEQIANSDSDDASQLEELRSFSVYLTEDSFNNDFKQDFWYAYTLGGGFFDIPSSWNDPINPWNKYFLDPERIKLINTANEGLATEPDFNAGYYQAVLDIEFEGQPYDFFDSSGEPIAKVNVRLLKISDALPDSIFYHLPFNGSVGLEGNDEKRTGYGLGLSSAVSVTSALNFGSKLPESTKFQISSQQIKNFAVSNDLNKGMLLVVGFNAEGKPSALWFAPSHAVSLLAKITSAGGSAQLKYNLLESQQPYGSDNIYINKWTGFGSTMADKCQDFYGNRLFYEKTDSKFEGTASDFGFSFAGISETANSKSIFLQTVFYTPVGSEFDLPDVPADSSELYSVKKDASNIDLTDASLLSVSSLESLVKEIENERICVAYDSASKTETYWWNPQKIFDETKTLTSQISGWSDDYLCPVASTTSGGAAPPIIITPPPNPNVIGNVDVLLFSDSSYTVPAAGVNESQTLYYEIRTFNGLNQPLDVSNIDISIKKPDNSVASTQLDKSSVNGIFRGSFSSCAAGTGNWSVSVTAADSANNSVSDSANFLISSLSSAQKFAFDWSTASFGGNGTRIINWKIQNTSSCPISIDKMRVRWFNDTDNAKLKQIRINSTTVFDNASGISSDSLADISNFQLNASSTFSSNNWLWFTEKINDDSEDFEIDFIFY